MAFERLVAGVVSMIGSQATGTLSATDIAFATRQTSEVNERDAWYALYQNYYDGLQANPDLLTMSGTDNSPDAHPNVARDYQQVHNICATVVDLLIERLGITGFETDGDATEATPEETYAAEVWDANDGDELQNVIHTGACVEGDAYLLIQWDSRDRIPRFYWQDGQTIMPVYDLDRPGEMKAAYKTWTETYYENGRERARSRLTVYRPARIEKYAAELGRSWSPWTQDVDGAGKPDGGVIIWTEDGTEDGVPFGVPIVHFANKARGRTFGRSELADLIAPQDELNRRAAATSDAIAFAGNPINALINVKSPIDAVTGQPVGFPVGPRQVWMLYPQDADQPIAATQLGATNVAAQTAAIFDQLKLIAAIAGAPLHLLTQEGAVPSGEALKTAEARLTAKAEDRITTFAPKWGEAMGYALKLATVFGGVVLKTDVALTPVWASVYTRSELADAQRAILVGELTGDREALRILGYDEDAIDQLIEEKKADTPPALQAVDGEVQRQAGLAVARADLGLEPQPDYERRARTPGGQ